MKRLISLLLLSLTGCATAGDYRAYVAAHESIEAARHNADAERWRAMAAIAQTGDSSAKIAAVMAMGMGHGNGIQPAQIRAPESVGDQALRWLNLIAPLAVQGYGIHANTAMGMRQSDNSTALGISTNSAFVGMAGKIQSPAANIMTTLSGTGVIGGGSYADTHNTDSHAISGSYNPIDNSNQGNPAAPLTCTTGPC